MGSQRYEEDEEYCQDLDELQSQHDYLFDEVVKLRMMLAGMGVEEYVEWLRHYEAQFKKQ